MYLGFFNGTDSFIKGTQDGQTQFYTVKKQFPTTNTHYNQSFQVVGSADHIEPSPMYSSYQQQFPAKEGVTKAPEPTVEEQLLAT